MEYERKPSGLLVPKQQILGIGTYHGKIFRKGRMIDEFVQPNLVVNQGLNDLLGVYLGAGSQKTNWFLALFQGNYSPVASDTAANFATNATECSSYENATRPAWTYAAPASQNITNSASPALYQFTADLTIYGAALLSSNVISGVGGVLFSEATFQSPKAVQTGDQLLLTYGFTAASA